MISPLIISPKAQLMAELHWLAKSIVHHGRCCERVGRNAYRIRGVTRPDVFRFAPELGPLETRLAKLVRELRESPSPNALIALRAKEAFAEASEDGRASSRIVAWALSLAILEDILASGGSVFVSDSTLHVSWPNWSSVTGQTGLRSALERLQRETRPHRVPHEVALALPAGLAGRRILSLLQEGEIRLCAASELHSGGASYLQIFAAAAAYWTMPIRDREGRSRRFVLTLSHSSLPHPVAIGLLEAGDGAPHSTARDDALGLTPSSFLKWLSVQASPAQTLDEMGARIKALYRALQPVAGVWEGSEGELQYASLQVIDDAAAGRSRVGSDLQYQKRLAYLSRLIRAQRAIHSLRERTQIDPRDLNATVRLLRDLSVPRVHLELTICGGLPPFSSALSGKLTLAFAADPRILKICSGPTGEILRGVFHAQQIESLLPSSGAVLLSTKGLFVEHSAQYSGGAVPGIDVGGRVSLRKIGVTSGVTASLISKRAYQLAQAYLASGRSQRAISDEFGSGGSKRQRRIEAAVRDLGLPDQLIHPKLRRPIYAASLADNLPEIVILNRKPQWRVLATEDATIYAAAAIGLWRRKWWNTVQRRVAEKEYVTGVKEWLQREDMSVGK